VSALDELRADLATVADLERAGAVLDWDQETQMPPGGVEDRANQLATVGRLSHELFTSDRIGELLERAGEEVAGQPYESFEASLVRVTKREWEQATRLPAELVENIARAGAEARPDWLRARQESDWSIFAPRMERTVEFSLALAEAHGWTASPYDALIERSEPGLSTRFLEGLFGELKEAIVPMVRAIAARPEAAPDEVLDRDFDPELQLGISLAVVQELGYDLERGRLDKSAHPFCVSLGAGDVRITTRVKRNIRDSCLFSTIHESGHGMYDQGIPKILDRSPLWGGASSGVHESQSRFWENLVCRSRAFWIYFFPRLAKVFPAQLADQTAESFFRANNRVRPSYIRVDADEVTYNLHVLMRFEIEKQLIEGSLAVGDVPEAWNQALDQYLGLAPTGALTGPLQDIHWVQAPLGGFVGYALGNLIGAQLLERVRVDVPEFDSLLAVGSFGPLLEWLHREVHAHGRKFTPDELTERASGGPIRSDAWIRYARAKFGEIYGLDW